jgi:ubiquinone/menaquinone biosynthesis C-methylase UbiE
MRRVDNPELLDSEDCPPEDVAKSLADLCSINRRFGGVSTTRALIERVAVATGEKRFSVLEVAAGFGEVPRLAAAQLAQRGIQLEVTLVDIKRSHLLPGDHSVVADALALPFPDNSVDLITCSLFAHHLPPGQVARFVREGLRVCRRALLINDLIRHPLHLALAYAAFPLMRSHVAWSDGLVSVRRAYVPEEMREMIRSAFSNGSAPRIQISRHFLFRMGVIAWKA